MSSIEGGMSSLLHLVGKAPAPCQPPANIENRPVLTTVRFSTSVIMREKSKPSTTVRFMDRQPLSQKGRNIDGK